MNNVFSVMWKSNRPALLAIVGSMIILVLLCIDGALMLQGNDSLKFPIKVGICFLNVFVTIQLIKSCKKLWDMSVEAEKLEQKMIDEIPEEEREKMYKEIAEMTGLPEDSFRIKPRNYKKERRGVILLLVAAVFGNGLSFFAQAFL